MLSPAERQAFELGAMLGAVEEQERAQEEAIDRVTDDQRYAFAAGHAVATVATEGYEEDYLPGR